MIEGRGNASLPIEIQISDNGPGVPDHIREHLFNPFISGKRDGQGLGLALVDKLVRDMNGLVQYSRDKENGRSSFRILLPMKRSEERRVGKECVSTCRSRWEPHQLKNNHNSIISTH